MAKVNDMLDRLERTLNDQVAHGPSESAQFRMLAIVSDIRTELGNSDPVPAPSGFRNMASFDDYVFAKVNSRKDINRIASRFNLTPSQVGAAYDRGELATGGLFF